MPIGGASVANYANTSSGTASGVVDSPGVAGAGVSSALTEPVATGGFMSVTIADATAIDPISSIGPNGSGWVAYVVLKGITSLVGTVDATKLTIQVSDPGYDTSGNATTVTRTITGVAHLRRQYPNGASKMISTDGTNVTMLVTLDDWIYSGTTLVSASIASGFYPSSVASSSPTRTNQSNIGYIKPLFGWINPQQETSGSTYAVEALAFHPSARSGQQVACVKFNVNDGVTTTSDVLVSVPTVSTRVTQGFPPEVWAGTLDMSTMTQGTICTANAKVYPWIGDSSAILDVGTDGTAWPTVRPISKLRIHCDRTGAYGGGYAYVKVGAVGGTVSATPATAKADPYATVTAALGALRTWNNSNKSHNDFGGGFIRLMDDGLGGAQLHTIATAPANAPGNTWVTIEKDPDTAAVISITFSVQSSFPSLCKWRNISLIPSAQTHNIIGNNTADEMVAMDNCVIDNTANKTIVSWYVYKYLHNLTLTGGQACNFNGLAATNNGLAIIAGMVGTATSTTTNQPLIMVGCNMPGFALSRGTTTQGNHGRIMYNNRVKYAAYEKLTTGETLLDGLANVQNLYDHDNSGAVVTCMNYFADGDLTTVGNYIDMHNTAVGNRSSRMYNDVVASEVVPSGVQKRGVSMFSIYDNYNFKDDRFSTGAGSVGTWAYGYSVGNIGNVSLFGAVSRANTDAPHNDNADTPYMGDAWLPSSEYNLFRVALGFSQAQIMAMFTNYLVAPQAVPAQGGNYIPLSGSTHLKSRVPVGRSILKRDLAGTLRRTDGTGAAGCYESA